VLTDYTTGPLLTVNPFILSHGYGIERVSLRIQLLDTVAFLYRIRVVTCHGQGFAFLDSFSIHIACSGAAEVVKLGAVIAVLRSNMPSFKYGFDSR
jgi:hypothetical protein